MSILYMIFRDVQKKKKNHLFTVFSQILNSGLLLPVIGG